MALQMLGNKITLHCDLRETLANIIRDISGKQFLQL